MGPAEQSETAVTQRAVPTARSGDVPTATAEPHGVAGDRARRPQRSGAAAGTVRKIFVKLVPAMLILVVWQLGVVINGSMMLPAPGEVVVGFFALLRDHQMWSALWTSNQALILGFAAAVVIGVPLGLAMGRFRRLELLTDGWLSIILVTPMAMIIPLLIMTFGFSLLSRAIIVLLFSLPMIAINCRAGVREVDPSLIEMARTMGAGELAVWRRILLPASSPAIWAGLRVGIGRAITGMVIVELLLAAVGVGQLLQEFRGSLESGKLYALVLIVVLESLILIGLAKRLERILIPWAGDSVASRR